MNLIHKAINEYNAAQSRVFKAKQGLEAKRQRLVALLQQYPIDTDDPAIRHHIINTEGRHSA